MIGRDGRCQHGRIFDPEEQREFCIDCFGEVLHLVAEGGLEVE